LTWAALAGVAWRHQFGTWEATLWCAVLLVQSLPYLAAVGISSVAARPARHGVPVPRPAQAGASALPEGAQIAAGN